MINDATPKDFAIFILTHGRAEIVVTYNEIKRAGYDGLIYIVIDDEDDQEDVYRRIYGEQVIKFCKSEVDKWTDRGDNKAEDKRAILWARNVTWEIASSLGLSHFMMLEDDQPAFMIRTTDSEYEVLGGKKIRHFNAWINMAIEFLHDMDADTVAFGQGGDFIGGVHSRGCRDMLKYKTMNSFICRTDRPIRFKGRYNEDCTDYVTGWMKGRGHWSIMALQVSQIETASLPGGMSETYKENGTYAKTAMSVCYAPSVVRFSMLRGQANERVHHNIRWNRVVPRIIRENNKK